LTASSLGENYIMYGICNIIEKFIKLVAVAAAIALAALLVCDLILRSSGIVPSQSIPLFNRWAAGLAGVCSIIWTLRQWSKMRIPIFDKPVEEAAAATPHSLDDLFGEALSENTISQVQSQRPSFESRARYWVVSQDFEKVYQTEHQGFLGTSFLNLLSGGSWTMRTPLLQRSYRSLATEGELLFAAIVIGNNAIGGNPEKRYPAAVVTSWNQHPSALRRLTSIAKELAIAYAGNVSRGMPKSAKIIADDKYRQFRHRPLPKKETGNLEVTLMDVRLSMNDLEDDGLPSSFVPLLLHRRNGLFAVVPWPVLLGKQIITPAMRQAPVRGHLTPLQSAS
jgi:hypothetical protein